MTSRSIPDTQSVLSLIEAYDPNGASLVTAEMKSKRLLLDMIKTKQAFTPIELMLVVETGLFVRLSYLAGLMVDTLAVVESWEEHEKDQEIAAIGSSLELLKNHFQAVTLGELMMQEVTDLLAEDEDDE
jgi:hypothetical protein